MDLELAVAFGLLLGVVAVFLLASCGARFWYKDCESLAGVVVRRILILFLVGEEEEEEEAFKRARLSSSAVWYQPILLESSVALEDSDGAVQQILNSGGTSFPLWKESSVGT